MFEVSMEITAAVKLKKRKKKEKKTCQNYYNMRCAPISIKC